MANHSFSFILWISVIRSPLVKYSASPVHLYPVHVLSQNEKETIECFLMFSTVFHIKLSDIKSWSLLTAFTYATGVTFGFPFSSTEANTKTFFSIISLIVEVIMLKKIQCKLFTFFLSEDKVEDRKDTCGVEDKQANEPGKLFFGTSFPKSDSFPYHFSNS